MCFALKYRDDTSTIILFFNNLKEILGYDESVLNSLNM
jgi:hypothetical protein